MATAFKYKYKTPLSQKVCLDYISHDNVSDMFNYKWEVINDRYYITFLEYKHNIRSLSNSPKPRFLVSFQSVPEGGTELCVEFVSQPLQPSPFVFTKEIHDFWKQKLDADLI